MLREDRIAWLEKKIQELREDDYFIEGTYIASGCSSFLNDLHSLEEYNKYYDELEELLEEDEELDKEAEYEEYYA